MSTSDLAPLFPSFDQALATFLHDSFDVPQESHSTLCEALINSQYRTWSDFLYIEAIDDLEYHDGSTRVPLTRHVQLQLQRFVDFGRRLTEQGLDWEEREHYTKKAFKEYCHGMVKARRTPTADGERSTPPMPPAAPESTHAPAHSTRSTPAVHNSPPTTACNTANHPTVGNPETPTGLPGSSHPGSTADSTSTGTSSYTWKYSPSTESSVHAYSQYGASSYQVRKPIYGAHGAPTCPFRKPLYSAYSMTYDSPVVRITKRHRDAIKLKLYHLHATLLLANWIYDAVT
eukprot:jgi/Psemu1/32839/gm1.32839_g